MTRRVETWEDSLLALVWHHFWEKYSEVMSLLSINCWKVYGKTIPFSVIPREDCYHFQVFFFPELDVMPLLIAFFFFLSSLTEVPAGNTQCGRRSSTHCGHIAILRLLMMSIIVTAWKWAFWSHNLLWSSQHQSVRVCRLWVWHQLSETLHSLSTVLWDFF